MLPKQARYQLRYTRINKRYTMSEGHTKPPRTDISRNIIQHQTERRKKNLQLFALPQLSPLDCPQRDCGKKR